MVFPIPRIIFFFNRKLSVLTQPHHPLSGTTENDAQFSWHLQLDAREHLTSNWHVPPACSQTLVPNFSDYVEYETL